MSVHVMDGVDELKFLEKQRLSKVALEAGEETEEPSLSISVGMDLAPSVRLLIAFQKSLREGLRAQFGSVLSSILFLLLMDPILPELKNRSCGPSVCGLCL